MSFKKCSILVSAGISALLLVAGTARAEDGMESMKYAVGCKAEGAEGAKCLDARRELEAMVADKLERLVSRGKFVTREEFEVVRDMAQKAREENAALREELAKLKS